jgi:hypothetical protein
VPVGAVKGAARITSTAVRCPHNELVGTGATRGAPNEVFTANLKAYDRRLSSIVAPEDV